MGGQLVTVVTPSYNQGRFIRATIESVLSQDYSGLEYIVMDGGSTDETAAVVAEYASRLTWISEKDRGQSHAVNKGFRLAKGSIVAWLNSDDLFLPGAVRRGVSGLEEQPGAGAAYGEGYLIDIDGKIKGRFPATEPFNLWKLVYVSDYILQQTVFFRKNVIEEVGYIDESLHWGMDWDLLIRIGKRYPLVYIPEHMGCLREYGAAKSFSGGHRRFRELAAIMRRHGTMRYPPGYIAYGLNTYENLVCNWIERAAPRTLARPARYLARAVAWGCDKVIVRTLREAQGWYSDGWAGPEVRLMLPRGSGKLRIRGSLPDTGGVVSEQRLTIAHMGVVAGERRFSVGDFDFVVPLPVVPDRAVELTITAAHQFVPGRVGKGRDWRRLAYMLAGVEWA